MLLTVQRGSSYMLADGRALRFTPSNVWPTGTLAAPTPLQSVRLNIRPFPVHGCALPMDGFSYTGTYTAATATTPELVEFSLDRSEVDLLQPGIRAHVFAVEGTTQAGNAVVLEAGQISVLA